MALHRSQIKAIKAKDNFRIRITKPKGAIEAINISKTKTTSSERARLIKLVKADAKDQNLKIETKDTPKETILLIKIMDAEKTIKGMQIRRNKRRKELGIR